ncbi:probable receptor-like protein kinase At1g49730 isoform X3 [Populus alba]|uniref:probable receptor-like protein kinase At1g49730 isoform X3 n=1 Tax=Populus alba TaxID=43335 RepID=UPI003CC79307
MVVYRHALLVLGLLAFIAKQLPSTTAGYYLSNCPLDLSGSNFTLAAAVCSNKDKRGQCCRYINAFLAISIARYANTTSNLGVASNVSDICLHSISQTMQLYGVPSNATIFCGLGTKIPVNYECGGRTTITQMLESPKFVSVAQNCRLPLSLKSDCKRCLNAGIIYLHHLVGTDNNVTLSTCRDAAFTALASQFDDASAVEIASCFFGVQGLNTPSEPPPSSVTPEAPPSPLTAAGPSQVMLGLPLKSTHHPYHLTLVPIVGIAVTTVAFVMLIVLIVLIRRKSRELEESENIDKTFPRSIPPPRPTRKFQEGPASMLRKFSYKETMKATDNFNTIVGQGGFGTVYKAEFSDGLVAAVKRMNKVSEQVPHVRVYGKWKLKGSSSLFDILSAASGSPLSWQTRMQIAIDVANALEYLHFYCDPPLCHRDIKSSNILLDENFVAKVADFGLAHASKDGSICFEPVNTDIRGTPGYMDPEYVVTQELTEKSDIYSYGVVLLEIVTARRAIQESRNLVEWSQVFMASDSRLPELVDPRIRDSFDMDQLQTIATIVRWCTQREGRARPSIKQVLRLLYESSDPMHSGFVRAVEDEECEGSEGRGRTSRGKSHKSDAIFHSGDGRYLASSSSTSRSYCSRSFLLETGSPQSPSNILSV